MARRTSIKDALKDVAVRLAREAERYVGERDTTVCLCAHARSEHCGCGTVCLAPEDPADKGKGSYKHCACQGFTPETERSGAV